MSASSSERGKRKWTTASQRRTFIVAVLSALWRWRSPPRSSRAIQSARAQAIADIEPATTRSNTGASFGPLKQIDAGDLKVGYVEAGPADGPAVILLHGWPYDLHSFAEVAPLLASAGYRAIAPHPRGYGTTRFPSADTPRNGEQAALAVDTIALMDALEIRKAVLAGFDWGARTADIVVALWPERCDGLVSVSGYLIGSHEAGQRPIPPSAELKLNDQSRWRRRHATGFFPANPRLQGKPCALPPDRHEKGILFSSLHNKQHVHHG